MRSSDENCTRRMKRENGIHCLDSSEVFSLQASGFFSHPLAHSVQNIFNCVNVHVVPGIRNVAFIINGSRWKFTNIRKKTITTHIQVRQHCLILLGSSEKLKSSRVLWEQMRQQLEGIKRTTLHEEEEDSLHERKLINYCWYELQITIE